MASNTPAQSKDPKWRWPEGAIVYQIYPRSFQDSNEDGIGDIPGIIRRLDYLKDLGVNAIWLSPFYPSPQADFGYDVSDFCDVDPMFGTLDDFDVLIRDAHERDVKVMVDLVPNHTSDQHPWFQHSKRSHDNEYADWYIWKDPKPGSNETNPEPPNNWRDALGGGTAWEWMPERNQFYLHSFNVHQPDLNWDNPKVRAAMHAVMRFWLDRGVDGFRVDAVLFMGKNPDFSDDSPNLEYVEGQTLLYHALIHDNSRGWTQAFDYLSDMADVLKEPKYKDSLRFMVTEAYPGYLEPQTLYLQFYQAMDPTVAAPFNFAGIDLPWAADDWRDFLHTFHGKLSSFNPHAIASYAFGNHDQPRLVSRLGEERARAAAVLLLTLPGMVYIYNGEEIGMHDVAIAPAQVQDPAAKGDPEHGRGRDPERTPMQWDSSDNAGFSTADHTWLPVADDYEENNVDLQLDDPDSFLNLYRLLGDMRNRLGSLKHGSIEELDTGHPDVLGYIRMSEDDRSDAVLVNFSDQPAELTIEQIKGELIISSLPNADEIADVPPAIRLRPNEARVYSL